MSKGTHKKKNKTIPKILLCIFTLSMLFSGYKIVMWFIENRQNDEIVKEISDTVVINEDTENKEKYTIDFNSLKEKNSETVAWIKVNNTNIEFPVVKTSNNDFYLTHSFDKTYNSAGWIFMDYKNKLDGTDKNIVIYGHNRRDDSMFGTLKNILNKDWYNNEENQTMYFITENESCEYQVFSVYSIEAEEYYITTEFKDDAEFMGFLTDVKNRSIKNFDVELSGSDEILTLSTCANNNKYRVVLHAVKVHK